MRGFLAAVVLAILAGAGLGQVATPSPAPAGDWEENFAYEKAAVLQMLDAERECIAKAPNRAAMRKCQGQ